MDKLLSMEFSIFIMLLLGFLSRKLKIVSAQAQKDITNLVLMVILPCNIFNSFLGQDVKQLAGECVAILLISIGIQFLALLYGKICFPKETEDHRINLAYAMICSNAGFLGNPIAESVFGTTGLMIASVYLIPQRIMMWSEGLAIYSGVSDKKQTMKKVLTHPCIVSCFLGIIAMVFSIEIPSFILAPIQTVGKCNTAMSMMVIGMILSNIDLKQLANKTILRFTFDRLVLMPLIVYGACLLLPVSATVRGVAVLLAAMPAGATTSMLSTVYNRDPEFATKLVVFTTLMSIPAIFIWSMILTV